MFLTTKEASDILGISKRRIRQLINANKLKAIKIGRDWMIYPNSLSKVDIYGKPGRPKKNIKQNQKDTLEIHK